MEEKSSVRPLSCNLIEYSVLHLHTEMKTDEKFSLPLSIRPDIRFDIGKKDYRAFVKCVYAVDGFAFSCGIEGSFEYCEPIDNKNLVSAWYNACTMIYGIMRGVFATTCAQSIHVTKFLPAVMMINEIKKRISELAKEAQSEKPDQPNQIEEPPAPEVQEKK